MGTYDLYHEARDRGLSQGERMSASTLVTLIRERQHQILELMTDEAFDGQAADDVVKKAGFADGLASALEGKI